MIPVELLNAWGGAWFGFMARALIETSVLLALILVVWLPLRRRMSAQLAHGLFCLVLLKLIVPVPLAGRWLAAAGVGGRATARAWRGTGAVESRRRAGSRRCPTQRGSCRRPATSGSSLADVSPPQPVVIAEAAAAPRVSAAADASAPVSPRSPAPVALSIQAVLMLGWACVAALLAGAVRPGDAEDAPADPPGRAASVRHGCRSTSRPCGAPWGCAAPFAGPSTPRLHSPAVGGLLRPTVIIPPDLDDSLTPKQLTWVLLHELAHVRRGDLWVVVVQRVVQAVFFFHPAVHLANWIIDELREYACDDAALAACKTSRRDCGEGFLAIVERSVERCPGGRAGARAVRSADADPPPPAPHPRRSAARSTRGCRRPAALGLLVLALASLWCRTARPGEVAAGTRNRPASDHLRDTRGSRIDGARTRPRTNPPAIARARSGTSRRARPKRRESRRGEVARGRRRGRSPSPIRRTARPWPPPATTRWSCCATWPPAG